MTTQPEALRLANRLESDLIRSQTMVDAAAELRRQHEEIERLKTVPMKYRRMEFNAQLQTENDSLRAQRDALLEALAWIDRRCPAVFLLQDLHKVHMEAAFDAGVCARAAIKAVEEGK